MNRPTLHKQNAFYILFLLVSAPLLAQNFTWKKGTNLVDVAGVYGTQGTAANANRPGSRDHASTWTDANGDFWLFGGNGYNDLGNFGYLNDLWKYNPSTNQWTWMSGGTAVNQVGVYGNFGIFASGNLPGCRWGASSFIDANGNLYLFGGYGYDMQGSFGELNDMWVYNIALNQWKWIKGASVCFQTATYGTQGVSALSNVPGARYTATSWKDASGNFWIFGGIGFNASSNSYLNDLWRYTPANNEWTWMKGSVVLNQFGTYGTQGTAAAANTPGSRCSSAGWTDSNGNLWLIAGYGFANAGPANLMSDLWRYNVTTNQWTWISGYNNSAVQTGVYGTQGVYANGNMPGARYDAVTWLDGTGDLWLSGGYGFATGNSPDFLNDLWRYDIAGNQWKWVKGANTTAQGGNYGTIGVNSPLNMPGSRGACATWKDGSNNLWLFGGGGYNVPNNVGKLNDLWKFDNCIGPTVTITASSYSICLGKTATLTATGANNYTWTGGPQQTGNTYTVAPLATTSYSAFASDANECRDTATVIISVLGLPSLTATTNHSVICQFESADITATGASTYTWSNTFVGATQNIGPLSTTVYTVTGTGSNGCTNFATITQSVSLCLSINGFGAFNGQVSLYPNPNSGDFTVDTDTNNDNQIMIFDAYGKLLLEQKLDAGKTLIKSGLPQGVYFYSIQNSFGQTLQGKLLIGQ